MSGRKKPVFGTISLTLMLGLFVTGILMTLFEPPLEPVGSDETFAVAIGAVANILATLFAGAAVSISSAILALVSLIRGEARGPAAVGLCLSLSCLVVLVMAITQL
jgi:hypothetical protein